MLKLFQGWHLAQPEEPSESQLGHWTVKPLALSGFGSDPYCQVLSAEDEPNEALVATHFPNTSGPLPSCAVRHAVRLSTQDCGNALFSLSYDVGRELVKNPFPITAATSAGW